MRESLNEAAESYFDKNVSAPYHFDITQDNVEDAFKAGAEWMQEQRMYNEEEVIELCKKSRDEGYDENTLERIGANEKIIPFEEWFEQFKKQ